MVVTFFPAYRQLVGAERKKLPQDAQKQLTKDPAEASDPRLLEYLILRDLSPPAEPAQISNITGAVELYLRAFSTGYGSQERIQLAKECIAQFPAWSADAYILLAEEHAQSIEKAMDYYQLALETARSTLLLSMMDPAYFDTHSGQFYRLIWTRPYCRAHAGIANCQFKLGRYTDALFNYTSLMSLMDVESIRDLDLFRMAQACLFHLGDISQNGGMVSYSSQDPACSSHYNRFLTSGDVQVLQRALELNPYAAMLLLEKGGRISASQIPYPNTIHLGYLSEAVSYYHLFHTFWTQDQLKQLAGCYAAYLKGRPMFNEDLVSECLQTAIYASFHGRLPRLPIDGRCASGSCTETGKSRCARCRKVACNMIHIAVQEYETHHDSV